MAGRPVHLDAITLHRLYAFFVIDGQRVPPGQRHQDRNQARRRDPGLTHQRGRDPAAAKDVEVSQRLTGHDPTASQHSPDPRTQIRRRMTTRASAAAHRFCETTWAEAGTRCTQLQLPGVGPLASDPGQPADPLGAVSQD